MKLTFLGANHEVTGSCTLLEAAGQRYLIDCGMEQGKDTYENQPIPVAPGEIDGVLATHAHIDHTGLLPLLARNGFRGRIYATNPTVELCGIMLRDSAHIQEFEAEWKNRKGKRSGAEPVEPMYTVQDAEAAIKLFRGVDYNTKLELAPGLVIEFVDVGHLLGSASIAIWVTENGTTTKLVFSGDIGNQNQPLIKDPTYLTDADYVVMESTYGDRLHGPRPDYIGELARILQRTFDRGGNVVIPSFAVGRTQELLYFIREIKEKGLVKGHGNFPVYIDSPLAIEATRIFRIPTLTVLTRRPAPCWPRASTHPVPRPAGQRDQRRIPDDQRRPGAEGHPFGQRHVRGRPHPPPSQAQPLAAGVHHPLCGLSGRRHTGPHPH